MRRHGRPALALRAGKTYTLSSCQEDNIGMMPRAAAAVFSHIAADPSHHYIFFMSYIEIYMELLQARMHPLPLWSRI